jgi:hypothetical protein
VVKAGVCRRHGAKAKGCSHPDCTNNTQKGGVCCKHGAKKKPSTMKEDKKIDSKIIKGIKAKRK